MAKLLNIRAEYTGFGYGVEANDAQGRHYVHERDDLSFDEASRLAERVRKAGKIDETRWSVRVPYGTEAWLIDGMEVTLMDDEERQAKGLF